MDYEAIADELLVEIRKAGYDAQIISGVSFKLGKNNRGAPKEVTYTLFCDDFDVTVSSDGVKVSTSAFGPGEDAISRKDEIAANIQCTTLAVSDEEDITAKMTWRVDIEADSSFFEYADPEMVPKILAEVAKYAERSKSEE